MRISDWSSDVCSSDLRRAPRHHQRPQGPSVVRFCADRSGHRLSFGRKPGRTQEMAGRAADSQGAYKRGFRRGKGARGWQQPASSGRTHCRSEEHTSELQSIMRISYAVFWLKKKSKTEIKYRKT